MNQSVAGAWSEMRSFYTYPSSVDLSYSQTFGAFQDQEAYRMVSLPGANPQLSITGKEGKDWACYVDTGSETDYYKSCGSSLKMGQGFWLISKTPWRVQETGINPTLDGDRMVSVPIQSGWNLIGNPFVVPVAWSSVKEANGIERGIQAFNGETFTTETLLKPYQGYYYYHTGSAGVLRIPYPFSVGEALKKTALEPRLMGITATMDGSKTSQIVFGRDVRGRSGLDEWDDFAPPLDYAVWGLRIQNSAVVSPYVQLSRDVRGTDQDGESYTLVFESKQAGQVRFKVDIPAEVADEVTLLDVLEYRLYNLRDTPALTWTIEPGKRMFEVWVGNSSYIAHRKTNLTPNNSQLLGNYPNPFNLHTTIRFGLPKTENIRLVVYDLMGREVRVLALGTWPAGVYEIPFDAGQLTSGVYWYALWAGDKQETRRMVLLKY